MVNVVLDKQLQQKLQSIGKRDIEIFSRLQEGTGLGNDFLGWLHLPQDLSEDIVVAIENTAQRLQKIAEKIVVVGIGGSYLGARAVISALQTNFVTPKHEVIYAGNHLSQDYMVDLLHLLDTTDYAIIVISKSGTTTEPAVAFRLLKQHCERKYGKANAKERIVCITDKEKGALKVMATQEQYETFVIPDNVGGRYSVLTPVGLLPIAVAGFNIRNILNGAKAMQKKLSVLNENNCALLYAKVRNYWLANGKSVEVLASFEPRFYYLIEWWKQLFGESEGKNNKGLFPTGLLYTTDLHSMGQYMQQGQRIMFETFLSVKQSENICQVPFDENNLDKLNFIAGKTLKEINEKAELGTILAHQQGGVPTLKIEIETLDEQTIGELIYFFEFSCGLSAYMLEVNPFDQPGVESYKTNMFALLNKPGYEKETKEIQTQIERL